MTTTVNASLNIQMSAQKTVTTGDITLPTLAFGLNLSQPQSAWSGSSNPNGVDAWSALVAMTAGTVTLDLTSLTQTGLSTALNETGNKLRAIQVVAPSTNSAVVQIAPGASNGYPSAGTISALAPGDQVVKTTGSSVAVDGTHKTITITGTGTDAVEIFMIFGT